MYNSHCAAVRSISPFLENMTSSGMLPGDMYRHTTTLQPPIRVMPDGKSIGHSEMANPQPTEVVLLQT